MIGKEVIDTLNDLFTFNNEINLNIDNSEVFDFDMDMYYLCKITKINNINMMKNDIKFEVFENESKFYNIKELFEIKNEEDLVNFHFQNSVVLNMIVHILNINKFITFVPHNNYELLNKIEVKKDKKEDILVKTFKSYDFIHLLGNLNKLVSVIYPYFDKFALYFKNTMVRKYNKVNKDFDYEISISEDNNNVSIRMAKAVDLIVKNFDELNYADINLVTIREISESEFLNQFSEIYKKKINNKNKSGDFKIKNNNIEFKVKNKMSFNKHRYKGNSYYFKNRKINHFDYYYRTKDLKQSNKNDNKENEVNKNENLSEVSNLSKIIDVNDLKDLI
jgi:hypothetical protein